MSSELIDHTIMMVCISIQKDNNSDQNFAKMNEYFLIKNGTKNEPSLKTPNLQGFCLTPNSLGERCNRKVTLHSPQGVD